MNKHATAQKQRDAGLRHKKVMEKFKGPYDCPKCCAPKSIEINKFSKTQKTVTWVAQCNRCSFWKKIELPILLGKIDVINRVGDLMRAD